MSGQSGQAMPTEIAQPGQQMNGVGGKGGGQPTQTAMGTPIVYGKTYLPQSDMVQNMPSTTGPLGQLINNVTQNNNPGYTDFGGGGDS